MTYCFAKVVKKFGKTKYSQEKRLNGVLSRTESNYNPYSNGIRIERDTFNAPADAEGVLILILMEYG